MSQLQRQSLVDMVSGAILVDRAATHGSPEDSFDTIAQLWGTYIYRKRGVAFTLDKTDVAMMMALLKVVRAANNPSHLDNYVDGAGYFILAGEPHV